MKKNLRIVSGIMLIVAASFVIFAVNHPECAFPWSNTLTCIMYGIYVVLMVVFFIASLKK